MYEEQRGDEEVVGRGLGSKKNREQGSVFAICETVGRKEETSAVKSDDGFHSRNPT